MIKVSKMNDGIIIPSSTEYLAEVDSFLEERFKKSGIDESIITDIAISVSELVNNAIIHGNKRNTDKKVEIKYSISATKLSVSISDEGEGFELSEVDDPIDDNNLLKEVGRGIFIVKNFVDDVKISSAPGGGTLVEIIKNI